MIALAPLSIPFPEIENPTEFSNLSQAAQDAIVGAMVGEYENGPPELEESVKDEIRAWAGIPMHNVQEHPTADAAVTKHIQPTK